MLNFLVQTFTAYPYIILFVGLLFAGETFLLPAIYFTLYGNLHLSYVVAVTMLSTMVSDAFWYFLGLHIKSRFSHRLLVGRREKAISRLSAAFSRESHTILFLSKFVYGTRTVAQVLAGMQPLPIRQYLSINFLGMISFLAFITTLAYSINATLGNLQGFIKDIRIVFFIFLLVLILTYVFMSIYFRKKWV